MRKHGEAAVAEVWGVMLPWPHTLSEREAAMRRIGRYIEESDRVPALGVIRFGMN